MLCSLLLIYMCFPGYLCTYCFVCSLCVPLSVVRVTLKFVMLSAVLYILCLWGRGEGVVVLCLVHVLLGISDYMFRCVCRSFLCFLYWFYICNIFQAL
jgi:hypothetical protein